MRDKYQPETWMQFIRNALILSLIVTTIWVGSVLLITWLLTVQIMLKR